MTNAEFESAMTRATRLAAKMVEAIPEDIDIFSVIAGSLIAAVGLCIVHHVPLEQAATLFRNVPLWSRADEILPPKEE